MSQMQPVPPVGRIVFHATRRSGEGTTTVAVEPLAHARCRTVAESMAVLGCVGVDAGWAPTRARLLGRGRRAVWCAVCRKRIRATTDQVSVLRVSW